MEKIEIVEFIILRKYCISYRYYKTIENNFKISLSSSSNIIDDVLYYIYKDSTIKSSRGIGDLRIHKYEINHVCLAEVMENMYII